MSAWHLLLVFGDSFQSIMEFPNHPIQSVEDTAKQLGVHPQDLCINWRLTIENAKVGEYIRPESRLSLRVLNMVQNQDY